VDVQDELLRELADKEAIRSVLFRYCRAIDRCDPELLATVYHPDATDDHGAYSGPAAGFIAWYLANAPRTLKTMQHSLGTILIELCGDVAVSEAYFTAKNLRRATTRTPELMDMLIGRYVDRFERRAGEWRIARRIVVKDFRDVRPVADEAEAYRASRQDRDDPLYEMLAELEPEAAQV
jgi:hypothetical protein